MSRGPLALEDEAFFADPRPAIAAHLEPLVDGGFSGLLLDGPTAVDLAAHDRLPLAGVSSLTTRELELGSPRGRALLVGSCADADAVVLGLALHPGKEPARRPPAAGRAPKGMPAPSPDKSVSTTSFAFDARERLSRLPWAPGTWSFWLVLRDLTSGPAVRVRLEGAPPAPAPTPAPAPPPWPAPVWPPESPERARYQEVEGAPPAPAGLGMTLVAERALVPTEPGARWPLLLSWRLPVRPAERVPEPAFTDPPTPPPASYPDLDPDVKAVVPITLVITGARAPGPFSVGLRVPCRDLSGDVGSGQVELDLLRVKGAPRAPGETYFIYAVAGDVLAGPAVTALVSEDALPKGVA